MNDDDASPGSRALRCGRASALVDPARGAEITSARLDGHELLSVMHWPRAAPPSATYLNEDEFTWAWAGGWQLAFPNAGDASTHRGRRHGFHGEASFRPWKVVEDSEASVLLEWTSGGLAARRRITVLEDGFQVSTEVAALGPEPEDFIAVEHLILGSAVTDGGYRLGVPDAGLVDLMDGTRKPLQWPGEIDDRSGSRWDEVPIGANLSRFGVVGPMSTGSIKVLPGGMESELELRWDSTKLPYVWIWQEQDGDSAPPWDGRTHALGIEPSMVPDGDGIESAAASGHLATVEPGEVLSWWVSLRLAGGSRLPN
jgi:hypothetical protein